jgi:hypothetical protein
VVGVFSTWTNTGSVTLNGTQGWNDGWLVLIVAAMALGWTRSMVRGSWTGVAGVFGAAVVMGWTAVDDWFDGRDVFDATPGLGLILVVAASVALACASISTAVSLVRESSDTTVA